MVSIRKRILHIFVSYKRIRLLLAVRTSMRIRVTGLGYCKVSTVTRYRPPP